MIVENILGEYWKL